MAQRKKQTRDFKRQAERLSFMRRHRTAIKRLTFGVIAVLLFCTSFSGYRMWKSGYIGKTYQAALAEIEKYEYQAALALGLNLKNVYINGEKYTSAKEIMKAAELKKNQPIFAIDLRALRNRIEDLDWVERADIERQVPDSLHINITERKPVAVWQNKGELALVDDKGEVISKEHIAEFPDLPLVVGEEANSDTKRIFAALKNEPELAAKVVSMVRVGSRRWNLKLKNNIEVLLPEDENLEHSIQYLAELDRKKQLLERRIKSVDLRLPDRVFIKESNG